MKCSEPGCDNEAAYEVDGQALCESCFAMHQALAKFLRGTNAMLSRTEKLLATIRQQSVKLNQPEQAQGRSSK